MIDTRWDDPSHVPLTNGPLPVTTPPITPTAKFEEDGQMLEFLVPFPMHIVDPKPWASLEVSLGGRSVFVHKPVPVTDRLIATGRLGNESPDVYSSILRVSCRPDPQNPDYPSSADCWGLLESLLTWIRVKARHYWLLHGQKGFGSLFRGTAFTQAGNQVEQRNFSSFGPITIVHPMDEALWLTIKAELNIKPPVAEALFCDALLSAVAGDEIKAVLELGVAAEVEITHLLSQTAQSPPDTAAKRKYANNGDWDRFKKKFTQWPQKLGLDDVTSFSMRGLYKGWFDIVRELYDLRGSVAHSGKLRSGVASRSLAEYLLATNALLQYSRVQRQKQGLPIYSFPAGRTPYEQIFIYRDGNFFAETSRSVAKFE
jgi:hypothetical protein